MRTRKCSKCEVVKILDMFHKNKKEKFGAGYMCKTCEKERCTEWQRTKDGMMAVIFASQKSSSKRRCHNLPTYTLEDLREWAYAQSEFHIMYDNWKRLDYQRWYKPSVDRIDDSIGYTMSNIQLMIWKDNSNKRVLQLKEASAISTHKLVIQISIDSGCIVNTFKSMGIASRTTGISKQNISATCIGKRKKAGGFRWEYKIKD